MQALDLHVEDRIRIDIDTVVLRDISGKAYLVFALDGLQIFQNIRIVTVLEQRFERVRVVQEAVADERLQIAGQGRVRLAQPAAVRNAVCDVQETAVIEIIIIPEDGFSRISVCSCETPLILWQQARQRFAMRTSLFVTAAIYSHLPGSFG